MNYRPLTADESEKLTSNGCRSGNWHLVLVKEGFEPDHYHNVTFSGNVKLGLSDKPHCKPSGIELESGIYNAHIHECQIGDNVLINNIHGYISNCDIHDGAYISDVGSIDATEDSYFGNGTSVRVMNETGGREVIIHEKLTSQSAYIMAIYRHNEVLIESLTRIINDDISRYRTGHATIEENVTIEGCGKIHNVTFRKNATATGASRLINGTVGEKAFVGADVIAENFIFADLSTVDSGAVVTNTYIGHCSEVSNGFTAHDSLFFSNCKMECGEACAVFAGPFSTSMHKSTLLIGGMFSFFNAGSGTNESNHLYRTGPVHQGIMRRGCKTGSGAYIMWPAHFGIFNFITGRHYKHPDTSRLPFSYVFGTEERSEAVPGINIIKIGTGRDLFKWMSRNKCPKDMKVHDIISNDIRPPLFIDNLNKGIEFLKQCKRDPSYSAAYNVYISEKNIDRGIEIYKQAESTVLGAIFLNMLLDLNFDFKDVISDIKHRWLDIGGMMTVESEIDKLCNDIIDGAIRTVDELNERFIEINGRYNQHIYQYAAQLIEMRYGIRFSSLSNQDMLRISRKWIDQFLNISKLFSEDANKDYSEDIKISFGADGNDSVRERDFSSVRGTYNTDSTVSQIREGYLVEIEKAHRVISKLRNTIAEKNKTS